MDFVENFSGAGPGAASAEKAPAGAGQKAAPAAIKTRTTSLDIPVLIGSPALAAMIAKFMDSCLIDESPGRDYTLVMKEARLLAVILFCAVASTDPRLGAFDSMGKSAGDGKKKPAPTVPEQPDPKDPKQVDNKGKKVIDPKREAIKPMAGPGTKSPPRKGAPISTPPPAANGGDSESTRPEFPEAAGAAPQESADPGGEDLGGPSPEARPPDDPERSGQVDRSTQRAGRRAGAMAERLRKGLPSVEDLEGSASGQAGRAGAGAGSDAPAARGATADPAQARDAADLALASSTGFKGVFKEMGLSASSGADGRPLIVRSDGTAASAEEIEVLSERIRSEPRALIQRPDFFAVISREAFEGLKKAYVERPDLREKQFKHVRMTEGLRDLAWSESCEKVSGECNEFAGASSYNRSGLVAPEDLRAIWSSFMSDDRPRRPDSSGEPVQRLLSKSAFSGLSAQGGLEWILGLFGSGSPAAARPPGNSGAVERGGGPGRREIFARKAPAARGRALPAPSPGADSARRERPVSPLAWLLLIAVVAALVLALRGTKGL